MNEEIDEGEFYHQDFTTASEWEVFIARLEEIIHQWKVEQSKQDVEEQTNAWTQKQEAVQFADVQFTITLLKYADKNVSDVDEENGVVLKTPIDTTYDFDVSTQDDISPHLVLAKWYGLQEFIVLCTANYNAAVNNESQVKVLLSSINVAISNTCSEIPIFIQIRDKWQKCYLGVYEGHDIRTNFEMVHLRKGPQHCKFLTGLLDLFKTKIMSPVPLDPISVSVQFTYHLSNWTSSTWRQEIPDVESDNFDAGSLCVLPIGVSFDPVNELDLMATWSHLPDHMVVDSENYSDFDPVQAPKWTVEVKMAERPVCLLAECLGEFLQITGNGNTVMDVLGDFAAAAAATAGSEAVNQALEILTESRVPSISNVLKRASRGGSISKSAKSIAPLSEELLVPMLYFLFPDATEKPAYPYAQASNLKESAMDFSFATEKSEDFETQCKGIKTCTRDSLVWRLAVVLAQSLHTLGGVRAFAHLWFEFSQEMRYRWEKSVSIPGLAPGFPDPRTCLLHQKLQMLNCCIDRKNARDNALSSSTTSDHFEEAYSSTDDEEFYDCSPDKQYDDGNTSSRKKYKHSLWNEPVGRLSKYGNLKLLKTGEQMFIPITQEPVPKTEDQLEEDTDVLLKLGTDAAGSELRAKMMSASLLSDMESFKAANPASVLEDFIRWYSPRDWIEEDEGEDEWGQKRGHLSARMMLSDNTWVQMWESGKPVPAHRQKRLFDDTREAEKVLHYLDSRTMAQVAELMLPVLSHTVICRLADETEQVSAELPDLAATLRHAIKSVERFSRDLKSSLRRYDAFIQEVATLELLGAQINSLLYKFNPSGAADEEVSDFVRNLVFGQEVKVEGSAQGKVGARLVSMFTEAQKAANMITTEPGVGEAWNSPGTSLFPQATKREFVMRVVTPRPAVYSARTPQLLRAIFAKNEFRLAGAFSEDVVFF